MRKKVILACIRCGMRNYSTLKKVSDSEKRLEINKFCKNCNTHTIHKETK